MEIGISRSLLGLLPLSSIGDGPNFRAKHQHFSSFNFPNSRLLCSRRVFSWGFVGHVQSILCAFRVVAENQECVTDGIKGFLVCPFTVHRFYTMNSSSFIGGSLWMLHKSKSIFSAFALILCFVLPFVCRLLRVNVSVCTSGLSLRSVLFGFGQSSSQVLRG